MLKPITQGKLKRENNSGLLEASGFQQLFQNEIETLENFHWGAAAGGVQSLSPEQPSARWALHCPRHRRPRHESPLGMSHFQFNRHWSWEREGGTGGLVVWWSPWTDSSDVSLQDTIYPAWTSADTQAHPEQDELCQCYCCAGSIHIHGKQPQIPTWVYCTDSPMHSPAVRTYMKK